MWFFARRGGGVGFIRAFQVAAGLGYKGGSCRSVKFAGV